MSTRFDKNKFHLGAYILQPYARTEQHIRDIAECGLDIIICLDAVENLKPLTYDTHVLDLLAKYNIGCVFSGNLPAWWGGDGGNAGKLGETHPISKYEEAARDFIDHPAIFGINLGDEPSALDFPYYGKVVKFVSDHFPRQFPYLNLYPNYASVAKNSDAQTVNQLGTATYAEHIDEYCKNVPTDYICYDFYVYSLHNTFKMYDNYRIVADACRKTGRAFWYVPQVNSNVEDKTMSENQLRFQAFTAMAFGAVNLYWACYTGGWWHHNVLDTDGNKTEQYEKLKKVNAEIRVIADEFMKYRNVSTHLVGFENDETMKPYADPLLPALSTGVFMDVHAENGEQLVIGQMVEKDGNGYALMIAAADDPYDEANKDITVTLRAGDFDVRALDGKGGNPLETCEDGSYRITLRSCEGVLVTAK